MTSQGPNTRSDSLSFASPNLSQVSTPSTICGTSGGGPQQCPATDTAKDPPRGGPIKQELLLPDGDGDVVIMFDHSAAPFFVKSHGAGLRVLIRDTKDLSRENVNALLSLLVPPERAPAANACPRLRFEPVNTGGTRIEVADTGLLTPTQLKAVRRAISGSAHDADDDQPEERANPPPFQQQEAAPAKAVNAPARRGRPPKDPIAPKRARTARAFFVEDYRVRTADTGLKPTEAIRAAWNQLSREER